MSMEIIHRHTADLKGYSRNARTHNESQIEQIAASITEFGFTNPILIDETSTIIAGHGRMAAALRLGLETVPCIVLSHLSDVQRRAYILADNKLALNAGWNQEMLALELSDLSGMINIDVIGFSEVELAGLLPIDPASGLTDPDAVPPTPADPETQPNDMWLLGQHRLFCGDSQDAAAWSALMAGEQMQAVWTDPPYNVNYGDKAMALSRVDRRHRNVDAILNDNLPQKEFKIFLNRVFSALRSVTAPGCPVYVAHSETERAAFTAAFVEAGFKLSSCLIWKKSQLVLGRSDYQYIHEPILYGWNPGRHPWFGGRKKTTVLEALSPVFNQIEEVDGGGYMVKSGDDVLYIKADALIEQWPSSILAVNKPTRSIEHPTMKPVELVERCLANSARPGWIIGDAFGGSGTTLIAAERLGMRARIMEMAPKYCDVIVRRWEQYTGEKAERIAA